MKRSDSATHRALRIWLGCGIGCFLCGFGGETLVQQLEAHRIVVLEGVSAVLISVGVLGAIALLLWMVTAAVVQCDEIVSKACGRVHTPLRDLLGKPRISGKREAKMVRYTRITTLIHLIFAGINVLSLGFATIGLIPLALHFIVSQIILSNLRTGYTEEESAVATMWTVLGIASFVLAFFSLFAAVPLGEWILGI